MFVGKRLLHKFVGQQRLHKLVGRRLLHKRLGQIALRKAQNRYIGEHGRAQEGREGGYVFYLRKILVYVSKYVFVFLIICNWPWHVCVQI